MSAGSVEWLALRRVHEGGITKRVSVRRCVHDEDDAAVTSTGLHPYDVAGHYDVNIGIGIQVPRTVGGAMPAAPGRTSGRSP